MATIDELLSGSDVLSDIDEVILVDPAARELIIPGDEVILGVVGDKNGECKYFKIDRTVGSHINVAACDIRILFKGVDDAEGKYSPVKEIASDNTAVVFCWEVPEDAVAHEGIVEFSVCLCNSGDGKEWHTAPAPGKVLRGLPCGAIQSGGSSAPSNPGTGATPGGSAGTITDAQLAAAIAKYFANNPVGSGVYVLSDGETLDDVPATFNVVIDPNGETDTDYDTGDTTPVIGMSHEWQGTTLVVTSASGTSSTDLRGPIGPQGIPGPQGPDGTSVTILGSFESEDALNSAHPTGSVGESYLINGYLYVWSANTNTWTNVGNIRGPQGPMGNDGKTPVKGVDYFTSSDKAEIVEELSVVNLLDNSDFRNPVNQRGKTAYEDGDIRFTIDRWKAPSKLRVDVLDSCLRLTCTSTSGANGLTQYLVKAPAAGTNVTLALLEADGTLHVGSIVVPSTGHTKAFEIDNGDVDVRLYSDARFTIMVGKGKAIDVAWVALYEGKYTDVTLPSYHPKGYAQELAACQRELPVLNSYCYGTEFPDNVPDGTIFFKKVT